MNDKRIENMATLDISSLESIENTLKSGVNVQTMSSYTTFSQLLNTAYCGPLSDQMGLKNKRVVDMGDLQKITESDTP